MNRKKIRMLIKIITICTLLITVFSTISFADSDDSGVFDRTKDVISKAVQKAAVFLTAGTGTMISSLVNSSGQSSGNQESPIFQTIFYGVGMDYAATIYSGIVGVFLALPKMLLLVTSFAIMGIMSAILSLSNSGVVLFTPETMLFNQVKLLDINFFSNISNNSASALYIVKENIAKWYVGLRNISIAALLVVIGYIGIRMALSTVSEDKAKYKKLLRYWIESFALLFLLHYIMILVINVNDGIVKMIYDSISKNKASNMATQITYIVKMIRINNISGFAAALVFAMNVGVSAAFFAMYLKRFMMIGFLIVISPLITITYSIDKVGDGKSQALDQWLKLFMYNVLIQPFHCILYLVFVSQAVSIVVSKGVSYLTDFETEIVGTILSVAAMMFMFKAEEILKQIFGFDKAGKSLMTGLVAGKMIGDAVKTGVKKTKSAAKTVGKFTGVDKKFKNSEIGKLLDSKEGRALKRYASSGATMATAAMMAPTSGSAAFSYLTTSIDKKKQEEDKLKDKLDDLKNDITKELYNIANQYQTDQQRTNEILQAYALDFKDQNAVSNAYQTRGIDYIKFASKLQNMVEMQKKLTGKNEMEILQEEVINTVISIP